MKGISMKIPVLNQIYSQRQLYHAHKQKLLQIRYERKNQLGSDLNRIHQLDHIKKNISSFAHKFNEKNIQIARSNIQILNRLEKVKPIYPMKSSDRVRIDRSFSSGSLNSRILNEHERENVRIRTKVKSMSSSLNNQSLSKDYNRSVEIRNRLMRYTSQNGKKVLLKSELYLENPYKTVSNSRQMQHKEQLKPIRQTSVNALASKEKKTPSLFYKKEEIMKNRIPSNQKIFKIKEQVLASVKKDFREKTLSKKPVQHQLPNSDKPIQMRDFVDEEMASNQEDAVFPTELDQPTQL